MQKLRYMYFQVAWLPSCFHYADARGRRCPWAELEYRLFRPVQPGWPLHPDKYSLVTDVIRDVNRLASLQINKLRICDTPVLQCGLSKHCLWVLLPSTPPPSASLNRRTITVPEYWCSVAYSLTLTNTLNKSPTWFKQSDCFITINLKRIACSFSGSVGAKTTTIVHGYSREIQLRRICSVMF